MSDIKFGCHEAARLDEMYQRDDVVRRRALVRAALDAQRGEDIIDVGCGPGYYVAEVAEAVGPNGSVLGIDLSEPMLAVAAARCEGKSNVAFKEGSARALPADDACADAVLSVQVLEYVRDIPHALAEIYRVLRPRGRVVIWDVDWSTVSWHSSDAGRMERVLRAWDEHLVYPSLPRTLGAQLEAAGFTDVRTDGHLFVNTDAGSEGYSSIGMQFIVDFVPGRNGVSADEAKAWSDDLLALSDRGEYFFSAAQFCFSARRST